MKEKKQLKLTEEQFLLNNVTCASCVTAIEKHFRKKHQIVANVNFATRKVYVTYPTDSFDRQKIIDEFKKIGYEVSDK